MRLSISSSDLKERLSLSRIFAFVSVLTVLLSGYLYSYSSGLFPPNNDNVYYSSLSYQLQFRDSFVKQTDELVAVIRSTSVDLNSSYFEERERVLTYVDFRVEEGRPSQLIIPAAVYRITDLFIYAFNGFKIGDIPDFFALRFSLMFLLSVVFVWSYLFFVYRRDLNSRSILSVFFLAIVLLMQQSFLQNSHFMASLFGSIWPLLPYHYEFWFFGLTPRFLIYPVAIFVFLLRWNGLRRSSYCLLFLSIFIHWGSGLTLIGAVLLIDLAKSPKKTFLDKFFWIYLLVITGSALLVRFAHPMFVLLCATGSLCFLPSIHQLLTERPNLVPIRTILSDLLFLIVIGQILVFCYQIPQDYLSQRMQEMVRVAIERYLATHLVILYFGLIFTLISFIRLRPFKTFTPPLIASLLILGIVLSFEGEDAIDKNYGWYREMEEARLSHQRFKNTTVQESLIYYISEVDLRNG